MTLADALEAHAVTALLVLTELMVALHELSEPVSDVSTALREHLMVAVQRSREVNRRWVTVALSSPDTLPPTKVHAKAEVSSLLKLDPNVTLPVLILIGVALGNDGVLRVLL